MHNTLFVRNPLVTLHDQNSYLNQSSEDTTSRKEATAFDYQRLEVSGQGAGGMLAAAASRSMKHHWSRLVAATAKGWLVKLIATGT